jgi:uncharacterized LabA/DUF88 family protein
LDTALVTDLIRSGIDGHYDRAVLVAADADHVPAIRFLGGRMKQVTHAWFRGQAGELRNACWNHLLLDELMPPLVDDRKPCPVESRPGPTFHVIGQPAS